MDKKINIVLNGDEATINGEDYIKKSSLKKPKEKKSNVPESWESLGEKSGYYLNDLSVVRECAPSKNRNVFTTIEEAEAVEAWAMLTQLRDATNGCPVEEVKEGWYVARYFSDATICVFDLSNTIRHRPTLLFKNRQDVDEFVEIHKKLIIKASKLTL